jgi:hypothetical protein
MKARNRTGATKNKLCDYCNINYEEKRCSRCKCNYICLGCWALGVVCNACKEALVELQRITLDSYKSTDLSTSLVKNSNESSGIKSKKIPGMVLIKI